MKNLKFIILVSILMLFISNCSSDDNNQVPSSNQAPQSFSVTADLIISEGNSILVNWDTATDPEGQVVTYSVNLEGISLIENLTSLTFTIPDLDYGTTYNGSISATDALGASTSVSFLVATTSMQSPIEGYVEALQRTIEPGFGPKEQGITFKPLKSGKIVGLKCGLLDQGSYRVSLWDTNDTSTPLVTETISTVSGGGSIETMQINEIEVIAGQEYTISVESVDFYKYESSAGPNIIFPETVEDIEILNYNSSIATDPPSYPTAQSANNRCFGFVGLLFVPTE